MANFFGKEDAVMKALAKVEDFDPHDLRRTAIVVSLADWSWLEWLSRPMANVENVDPCCRRR
jgi:hypothetical protein